MIKKAENKSNFTVLSNAALLDEAISDKARGVLVRLLCRPDNWNLNVNYLVKTGKDGHTAIRSAIRELEKAGYIQREVSRHENGRIIGVEYTIHESPVKPCGDRPAPEQRASSCKGTVRPERPDNEDAEPELITMPDPEPETHIEDADIMGSHMTETVTKETALIINTDIKQILKETTTTPAREAEPLSLSSLFPSNVILNLIPEKHKSPMVLNFVNKAIVDYPAKDVEEALAYAGANVRGGSMQFKAYLDKTLKNKWAEGYLDSFGAGQFPNGFTTGSKRMDGNLAACLEFAAYCENRKEATA